VLEDGVAEDVEIVSVAGDGVKVVGAPGTTLLRDSVVRTEDSDGGSAAVRLGNPGGGDIALRNVTAIAPQATAIRCDVSGGSQATLVNVIARGGAADVDASIGGPGCGASYSNLRTERSPSLVLGDGVQSAEPIFADATGGDFRPLAGSPTIDAGTPDQLNGLNDPDGRPRGDTPDIGAYECCATAPEVLPTPTPEPTPVAEPAGKDKEKDDQGEKEGHKPRPALGSSIVVAPGQGTVLVRRPVARVSNRSTRPPSSPWARSSTRGSGASASPPRSTTARCRPARSGAAVSRSSSAPASTA
jgi:hypothetical protein